MKVQVLDFKLKHFFRRCFRLGGRLNIRQNRICTSSNDLRRFNLILSIKKTISDQIGAIEDANLLLHLLKKLGLWMMIHHHGMRLYF